jgi:hypothetical protein
VLAQRWAHRTIGCRSLQLLCSKGVAVAAMHPAFAQQWETARSAEEGMGGAQQKTRRDRSPQTFERGSAMPLSTRAQRHWRSTPGRGRKLFLAAESPSHRQGSDDQAGQGKAHSNQGPRAAPRRAGKSQRRIQHGCQNDGSTSSNGQTVTPPAKHLPAPPSHSSSRNIHAQPSSVKELDDRP